MITQFLYNMGLATDQFVNVLLLGDPDESLSGRLGRAALSGRPKWWVKPLMKANDFIWLALANEANHSINAYEPEEKHEKELWSWINQ